MSRAVLEIGPERKREKPDALGLNIPEIVIGEATERTTRARVEPDGLVKEVPGLQRWVAGVGGGIVAAFGYMPPSPLPIKQITVIIDWE